SRNENQCSSCEPEKFAPLHLAHLSFHDGLTWLPAHASTPIDPSPTNDKGARSGGASIIFIPPLSPGRSTHAVSTWSSPEMGWPLLENQNPSRPMRKAAANPTSSTWRPPRCHRANAIAPSASMLPQ